MKKNLVILIPFILGIGCLLAFNLIGSEVAPDGTLIEPFFLIPLSYLFIGFGIITSIFILISKIKKTQRT